MLGEAPEQDVDGSVLEVVRRPLPFALAVDVGVRDALDPRDVPDRIDALHEHGEPLEPVGDLGRDQIELEPALLEVRELGDLHAVTPDLPAEPPGAERRPFPVVLDEAHVVLHGVDADRLQRAEVLVEHVLGRRLQHDCAW